MITSEQIKQDWDCRDGWYQNPETMLWLKIGDGVTLGNGVILGDWVRLGDGVNVPNGLNGMTFQMGFMPMTVSGDEIISGCHRMKPSEWLKYMTRENCRAEGLKNCFHPFYVDFVKSVIRLQGGTKC